MDFKLQVHSFQTQFRDRWRSRKFRNNGHACTSIVVQINTDDEKDGFELFTGTMMYFRVLLYVREFTEQHHFRTSGPGRSLPVDSGCCSADLRVGKRKEQLDKSTGRQNALVAGRVMVDTLLLVYAARRSRLRSLRLYS